jgi:hypothetical protein
MCFDTSRSKRGNVCANTISYCWCMRGIGVSWCSGSAAKPRGHTKQLPNAALSLRFLVRFLALSTSRSSVAHRSAASSTTVGAKRFPDYVTSWGVSERPAKHNRTQPQVEPLTDQPPPRGRLHPESSPTRCLSGHAARAGLALAGSSATEAMQVRTLKQRGCVCIHKRTLTHASRSTSSYARCNDG